MPGTGLRRALVVASVVWVILGASPGPAGAQRQPTASDIVALSGAVGGLCVHLGVSDGRLTAALHSGGRFLVHGLAPDGASVERARKYIRDQGICGKVSVERSDFRRLPYAENLVNLVVADDLPSRLAKGLSLKEVMRVLAPNGVAMLGRCDEKALTAAEIKNVRIVEASGERWAKITKPRPAGMDDWTHHRHAPDGNPVSKDTVVAPPTRLRWIGEPRHKSMHGSATGQVVAAVSCNGRLFYVIYDDLSLVRVPDRLWLYARDAHNGLLLWKRLIPLGRTRNRRTPFRSTMVATRDRLYAVLRPGGPLVALDATTGNIVHTYEKHRPSQVLSCRDHLILCVATGIRAVKADTGQAVWQHPAKVTYCTPGILAADGRVFYATGVIDQKTIVCLDAATGEEQWRKPIGPWLPEWTKSFERGIGGYYGYRPLLCLYYQGTLILSGRGGTFGVSAKDGSHLWSFKYRPAKAYTDVKGIGGLIWVHAVTKPPSGRTLARGQSAETWIGFDPSSGVERKRLPISIFSHRRCYPDRATERFFISNSMNFFDRDTGQQQFSAHARGACGLGYLPANGLLYTFPTHCGCYSMMRGVMGLAGSPERDPAPEIGAAMRLERGAAADTPLPESSASAENDWPTYRHDPERSGATPSAVPADLKRLWAAEIGGRLTAPVIAQDSVFVSSIDSHQVYCVAAETGEVRWRATAGGRVDMPPTIHNGLCLFGCRDGWVYCLRADNGKRVWRFRAAAEDRLIGAFDQLESAWPVYGSVLVHEDVAYFAAGRHSNIDGGLRLYAVHARTGELIWAASPTGAETAGVGKNWPTGVVGRAGFLVDLLALGRDGQIHMRRQMVDPKTGRSGRQNYGWFLRNGWMSDVVDRPALSNLTYTRAVGGHLLVFDKTRAFAVRAVDRKGHNTPGRGQYGLFAVDMKSRGEATKAWDLSGVPIRVEAMVLANDTLFVAGPADRPFDPGARDPYAPFEGRSAGIVQAYAAADGRKLAEVRAAAQPVLDGLAAAGGRLYVACADGTLVCFGEK